MLGKGRGGVGEGGNWAGKREEEMENNRKAGIEKRIRDKKAGR
jgi:hypothetical protein